MDDTHEKTSAQAAAGCGREPVTIRLDGRPHALPQGTTVAALVTALGHEPNAVSTAVNGLFVARGEREACVLKSGDAVLLFQPIVGG